MSYLASLFAEPSTPQSNEHLTDRRFVDLEPKEGETSYLVCLSRTIADALIVENRSWLGRTIEVLAQGLLLETDCPLHTGDMIRLEMAVDTRVLEGAGEVLHVQIRADGLSTVLFEFHELTDESRNLLDAVAAAR
jgi:PilZ domain